MIQTRSEIEQPKQANNNVLGIAQVVCKRLNRALDFVNQHRVHLLMKGLCRAVSHLMVCARLPCSPLSKKIAHASWDALKVLIAWHCNRGATLFDHLRSSWPGNGECMTPTTIFNDLLLKIAVRK